MLISLSVYEQFVSTIRKANAEYLRLLESHTRHIANARDKYQNIAATALERELHSRFKRGYWCICWAHSTDGGDIVDALNATDSAVQLHAAPDSSKFPHIDRFKTWSNLAWYYLSETDIIMAHNDASAMVVVFAPEQYYYVQKLISERTYSLYKNCL